VGGSWGWGGDFIVGEGGLGGPIRIHIDYILNSLNTVEM
jgi:hypothetical protein